MDGSPSARRRRSVRRTGPTIWAFLVRHRQNLCSERFRCPRHSARYPDQGILQDRRLPRSREPQGVVETDPHQHRIAEIATASRGGPSRGLPSLFGRERCSRRGVVSSSRRRRRGRGAERSSAVRSCRDRPAARHISRHRIVAGHLRVFDGRSGWDAPHYARGGQGSTSSSAVGVAGTCGTAVLGTGLATLKPCSRRTWSPFAEIVRTSLESSDLGET